jgi:penicillin-binding protein 2
MALQDFTMRRLRSEESATCVVIDVVTGELLVMASSPSYDANTFTGGISNAIWQQLNTDPLVPLNNKAIQGVYPPGSTFKPVVAIAALDAGVITPDFRANCPGVFTVGDHDYHCWRHGGHGTLDLHGGLKNSCDVYFYNVAMKLGVDRVAAMANRLGMGVLTGVDIPNERAGNIPTRAWKLAKYGVRWVWCRTAWSCRISCAKAASSCRTSRSIRIWGSRSSRRSVSIPPMSPPCCRA